MRNQVWIGLGALAAVAALPGAGQAQVCSSAPQVCSSAGRSVFVYKNRSDDTKDKLVYKWLKGEATDPADFLDPTTTTSTALCLYAGTAAALISEQVVPPSSTLWRLGKNMKLLYKDPPAAADGIRWMLLRSGATNKARVIVKGRGVDTPDLPLPFADFPLVVQVQQDDGLPCWGSTFNSATSNHSKRLKARAP